MYSNVFCTNFVTFITVNSIQTLLFGQFGCYYYSNFVTEDETELELKQQSREFALNAAYKNKIAQTIYNLKTYNIPQRLYYEIKS